MKISTFSGIIFSLNSEHIWLCITFDYFVFSILLTVLEEIIVITDSDSSQESLWVIFSSITINSITQCMHNFLPIKLQLTNI